MAQALGMVVTACNPLSLEHPPIMVAAVAAHATAETLHLFRVLVVLVAAETGVLIVKTGLPEQRILVAVVVAHRVAYQQQMVALADPA